MNQRIAKIQTLNPMENYRQGYGKERSSGSEDGNAVLQDPMKFEPFKPIEKAVLSMRISRSFYERKPFFLSRDRIR